MKEPFEQIAAALDRVASIAERVPDDVGVAGAGFAGRSDGAVDLFLTLR